MTHRPQSAYNKIQSIEEEQKLDRAMYMFRRFSEHYAPKDPHEAHVFQSDLHGLILASTGQALEAQNKMVKDIMENVLLSHPFPTPIIPKG